jgi:hypothetical protein
MVYLGAAKRRQTGFSAAFYRFIGPQVRPYLEFSDSLSRDVLGSSGSCSLTFPEQHTYERRYRIWTQV